MSPFGSVLEPGRRLWALRGVWRGQGLNLMPFWLPFGVPFGTILGHFELILVIFFVNWAAEMSVLVPGWFLSDLGGEVAPEPDAGMCLNHSKY